MIVETLRGAPEPAEACARFLDLPCCLLLESADHAAETGRYSFLAADPFLTLRSRGTRLERRDAGGRQELRGDPFELLREALAAWWLESRPDLPPFPGGVAGYFAYDLCHHLEQLPSPPLDDLCLPELCVGFYDWVLGWDHHEQRSWLVSTGFPEPEGGGRAERAGARAAEVQARLRGAPVIGPSGSPRAGASFGGASGTASAATRDASAPTHPVSGLAGVRSTFTRAAYLDAVGRVREYVLAGDVFQANLSHRLEAPLSSSAWALYRRLRRRNPAPFAAYLDLGDAAVVSASPERFLRLDGRRVQTRPIKGTAPRGATPAEDERLRAALRASEKDRAENVMIVDLLRNDLSIVCANGTVAVPQLCTVESHPTVHHLVSVVTGTLRPDRDAIDLLRAAFPGGSITGAPKVRAMEIIAEIEPTRRGVYTGAIGYLGFDGTMDSSIAIRTFIATRGRVVFQVGGGIVADSDPASEYAETLDKARGLLAALADYACDEGGA